MASYDIPICEHCGLPTELGRKQFGPRGYHHVAWFCFCCGRYAREESGRWWIRHDVVADIIGGLEFQDIREI